MSTPSGSWKWSGNIRTGNGGTDLGVADAIPVAVLKRIIREAIGRPHLLHTTENIV